MATGAGPSRDQLSAQGEGLDEVSEAEAQARGALHEEMAIKEEDEEKATKGEDEGRSIMEEGEGKPIKDEGEDEEKAQYLRGIVPTSSTIRPWSRIHGGISCELASPVS